MKRVLVWAVRILVALGVAILAVAFVGPRERFGTWEFDASQIGEDIDAYLAAQEARFDDVVPGVEKRVIWAGEAGGATPVALLYVHGFSATSEEIRPVPDEVARALGANLVYTRLKGHGRGAAALAEPRAADWMADYAEAVGVARKVGQRVIVLATSTGGTLAAIGASDPDLAVDALVMVSPNFAVVAGAARILTWPYARIWAPIVAGPERAFRAANADHARYWTTRYPTVALLPMAAAVAEARKLDYAAIQTPALFLFSPQDRVVQPSVTRRVAGVWGGPATLMPVTVGPGDDPLSHVIAGDILSPGMTDQVVETILEWINTL